MKPISIGKFRSLQQCSNDRGAISVLALDHRQNLRNSLRPQAPESVTPAELTAFKVEVMEKLAPLSTAVLLDPEVGAAQCIAASAVPGQVGMLIAVEATGYTGDPTARQSGILPGWSVAKVRRIGANAAKLLVYYHPQAATAAEIEALVAKVAADCAAQDLLLFVEPLSYSLDPVHKKLSPEERRQVVIETARRLTPLGVDVLKAEFPLDTQAEPDERVWAAACADLTEASSAPWVLLSAAVDYDTFLRQVTVACQNGASGVAVGRAVWKEATDLTGEARTSFLAGVARRRMERITALCNALARPWTTVYSPPTITADWYKSY
jgi:tagatose-1,6-bisphosphate aldolase